MIKHHSSPQNIKAAVDTCILSIQDDELHVLLIQMKKQPFEGQWALPGGLLEEEETSEQAASRILKESTGLTQVYLEQLMTFDEPDRDPAGRVISIAHVALVPDEHASLKTSEKYLDVKWWPVSKLPPLAYDHKTIVQTTLERVKTKIQYTNIAWSLLAKEFTLTELQRVYEIVMDQDLDKRNFRKRINELHLIQATGHKRSGQAHRPAALYRFKERKLVYVQVV
ncbi:MAG: NUDIX hydrolase [Parcubacteria group bacterium]|nr:NUDIX hydrolase [Parcubacteria group bacterium]